MEDAGFYRADINLKTSSTSTTITKNYTLQIYRRLEQPKITLNALASENNTCNITLTCSVEIREAVKYEWTPLGEQTAESDGKSRLFIFWTSGDVPKNYTCLATNPVSKNSQSILVKNSCAGTLMISGPPWYALISVLEMLVIFSLAGVGFYLWHKIRSTASRENNAPVVVTGILGESAILPADIPDKNKIDNINWASRTPVAVVTPEGTAVNIITTHQNYKGRLNVSSKTYDLQINHLKMEDAGFYRADINLKTSSTSTTITKNYTLQIYRRLEQPKITLNTIASENNTCNITLTCSVEIGDAVKYEWTPLGEQTDESNGKSRLFIFQTSEDVPKNYTCMAKNPVSKNSQSILVQYPCTGIGEERALKEGDDFKSPYPRPGISKSSNLWFILISILIILISTATCFYLRYKGKKDADSSFITQGNTGKEPSAPADNRVYDEIVIPKGIVSTPQKEESLNTIYYTVQKPQKVENSYSSNTKLLGTSTSDFVI
ncbi:SLAM family member 5-like [Monodelphis domestica]|uniref:SLAM family member 5-like n=1 Tax=Monodelphis domestica TaxID=13616 RepID=UPI0024E27582|nr:SLAM family member 5-like [Monodelphis domestica]